MCLCAFPHKGTLCHDVGTHTHGYRGLLVQLRLKWPGLACREEGGQRRAPSPPPSARDERVLYFCRTQLTCFPFGPFAHDVCIIFKGGRHTHTRVGYVCICFGSHTHSRAYVRSYVMIIIIIVIAVVVGELAASSSAGRPQTEGGGGGS